MTVSLERLQRETAAQAAKADSYQKLQQEALSTTTLFTSFPLLDKKMLLTKIGLLSRTFLTY